MKKLSILSLLAALLFQFSAAQANDDLTINLLSRTIDTGAEIQRSEASGEDFIIGARDQHILVQFTDIPSDAERAQLSKAGIELLQYVPNNAWFVKVDESVNLSLAPEGLIRWAGSVQAQDKISPSLRSAGIGDWAVKDDGTVELQISFFDNVDRNEITSLLAKHGALEVSGTNNSYFVARFADDSAVNKLAGEDIVQYVDNGPAPRHPRVLQGTSVPKNAGARVITRVDALQTAVATATGTGTRLAVFDDRVDDTHPDFAGRITIPIALAATTENHGTHVAGTMAGSGAVTLANRGVATAAQIFSYSNQGDFLATHENAIQTQTVDLSQNSWGGNFTSAVCDTHNIYSQDARSMDQIVTGEAWTRGIVVAVAASNFRQGTSDDQAETDPICNFNPGPDYINYTSLSDLGSAKNILSVGATQKVGTNRMADFSSWGPTRDGRLKPDLVAPGEDIVSTVPGGGYASLSGTSMATPHVSGIAALVIQRYQDVFSNRPLPATVRAIMIQSATDLNNSSDHVYYTTGPDFASGYGMANAEAAYAAVVENRVLQREIANGATDGALTIAVPASQAELKVTLAWDDPAATLGTTTQLVNNLDLELVAPDGQTVHLPWVLNPNSPATAATRGVDSLNNVEQVLVSNPTEGTWTVRVKGTAVPTSSPQKFSLVSSIAMTSGTTPPPATTYLVSTNVTGTGTGSVDPTSRTVNEGQTTTFTVTPTNGSTASASGCSGSLSGTTYTTGAINAACTVEVVFTAATTQPTTYLVSTNVTGTGTGTISPTSATVNAGQTAAFTVTPTNGSTASASGCGGSLSGTTYTTGEINAACTVTAVFTAATTAPTTFPVTTVNVQGNGTISPTSVDVEDGQTAIFTLSPNAGFIVESATGCGGTLAGNTYTTGPITAACSISVVFGPAGAVGEARAIPVMNHWSLAVFALFMLLVGGLSLRFYRL